MSNLEVRNNFCYWSIGDGEHGQMLRTLVKSARNVGVTEDIHVWTDIDIPDCTVHKIKTNSFNKELYMFKLHFLKNEVSHLKYDHFEYDHFVFLDADCFFVRRPINVLIHTPSPLHVTLESYCPNPDNKRPDWWSCPLQKYEELMRAKGVISKRIYNCNAGFWVVNRLAIDIIYELCITFHDYCKDKGYTFTEEAPLAYAMQMLCADTEPHTLRNTTSVWASDWTGIYKGRLPDGKPFPFTDYFTGEKFTVDPAIVHAMRSKDVLKG